MHGLLRAVLLLAPVSALARGGDAGRHDVTPSADAPWDPAVPDWPDAPVAPEMPDMPELPDVPEAPIVTDEEETTDGLDFELAELEFLLDQKAGLEEMIAFQEQRLAEEYGWSPQGGDGECHGLKCLVENIVEKVSDVAMSFYEEIAGAEDITQSTESRVSLIALASSLTTAGHTTETTHTTEITPMAITPSLTRHPGAALTDSRTTLPRSAVVHHHRTTAVRLPRRLRQAILLIVAGPNTRLRRHHQVILLTVADLNTLLRLRHRLQATLLIAADLNTRLRRRQTTHLIADHRIEGPVTTVDARHPQTRTRDRIPMMTNQVLLGQVLLLPTRKTTASLRLHTTTTTTVLRATMVHRTTTAHRRTTAHRGTTSPYPSK
ncbi:hypothetical protein CONLIGDRAFT_678922 [Coniochaeta ligniaria NRRL 30616]|uniref:Uncharacterized protein n=1 Tax=Coniochaeta ligniaria NRRL 30616 TaxID=1408157 RepID=A0A1J7JT50_9PEZI|nr:hypothetical protein CONLIGDRAFT_678922 [Coniochaeta ligniaria NRRL 30616]